MKWVLKFGGSQYTHANLLQLIRHAAEFQPPPVIVPGGGPFADQVRRAQNRWLFDDATAHKMAVLGMRQYGRMLAALGGLPASESIRPLSPSVWLPTDDLRVDRSDWTLTSDSIAASLAQSIGAGGLVLLKPVCDQPTASLVDEQFMRIAKTMRVAVVDPEAWLAMRDADDLNRRLELV